METIKVIVDWLENYGTVSDSIPGCVATHQTFLGIQEVYVSAVDFHLEGLEVDEIPACLSGQYSFEFKLSTRALLHRLDGLLTHAAIARETGINEKQLQHYMTGFRTARPDKRDKIINSIHHIGQELLDVV